MEQHPPMKKASWINMENHLRTFKISVLIEINQIQTATQNIMEQIQLEILFQLILILIITSYLTSHNVSYLTFIVYHLFLFMNLVLYDYTNKERDLIQRCFRAGNYNALRELPNHLAPNQVLKYQREKQDANINFTNPNQPRVQKLTGGGLF